MLDVHLRTQAPVEQRGNEAFLEARPVPAGSQVGQFWHVSRGWPVYGKASHICILTAVHEDGSGELSTFRRPSRGFARHLRKRQ